MAWTSDDLVSAVRRRAQLPDSSADGALSDADILSLADEEISTLCLPVLHSAREDYHVKFSTTSVSSSTSRYRIPSRAVANGLRELTLLDGTDEINLTQVPLENKDGYTSGGLYVSSLTRSPSYVIEGDEVVLVPSDHGLSGSLKFYYYFRPGTLVLTSSSQVMSITGVSGAVYSGSAPAGWSTSTSLDAVQAVPGFDLLLEATTPSSVSASTSVTFSSAVTDLATGDYICEEGVTPIIQLPPEMHPLLYSAVLVRVFEALGDYEAAQASVRARETQTERVLKLLEPRNIGERMNVVNWYSPLRGGGYRRRSF